MTNNLNENLSILTENEQKKNFENDEKLEQQWRFVCSVVDRVILYIHIAVFVAVLRFFYVQIKE